MQVRFVYDYRSIYSYLANSQIDTLATDVEYQLVDIVAVMQEVHNQPTPKCPAKLTYSKLDAQRWAEIYGIELSPNDQLLEAMRSGAIPSGYFSRVGISAQQLGIFKEVNNALFRAVWAGTDDLITQNGRNQFSRKHEIPLVVWDLADAPEILLELAKNNKSAIESGVFGAPTFYVGDEMYFGNDRIDFVRRSIENKHKREIL
ncbi:DsbA family protein [Pantoea sp. NPDC088449]|uniref:DsbA family protein n=1 Tax=Pantoea sp. NPDC088449 TaxID=3364392 RepID=UPI00381906E7